MTSRRLSPPLRILITGMEGFAGSHLAEFALRQGAQVHGTVYPGASRQNLAGIRAAGIHSLDVTRAQGVRRLVLRLRPARIFHLAGQSNPALSKKDPETTLRINILGTLNVLEAALALGKSTRVLVVGSADEYGGTGPEVKRITEAQPLRPASPYAVSKVCQDLLGEAYFRSQGLQIVRVRPFNHIGPRQAPGFVASDFASQIAAIEKRRRPPVMDVGNLDVIRDFSDVRDIAAGYWRLLQAGRPGRVYNLGSGRPCTVRHLLEGLLALAACPVRIRVKASRVRREHLRKVASIARVGRELGWKPRIPLQQTLRDILNDWRQRP